MDYILVVMGKYLQMLVAHSIFKEEPDRVTDHFEEFNGDFYKVCDVFKVVTDQVFMAGQEVRLVKPILKESKAELGLSDNERVTLQQFLELHDLQELLRIVCQNIAKYPGVLLNIARQGRPFLYHHHATYHHQSTTQARVSLKLKLPIKNVKHFLHS